MRKKPGFTIVEQAIVLVPDFEKVGHKPDQQDTLRGQSISTLKNYIRRNALFVLRFGILPGQIDPDEINEQEELSLFYNAVQQTIKPNGLNKGIVPLPVSANHRP
jgi:hypothetical protein